MERENEEGKVAAQAISGRRVFAEVCVCVCACVRMEGMFVCV